jgi:hypothetical protein
MMVKNGVLHGMPQAQSEGCLENQTGGTLGKPVINGLLFLVWCERLACALNYSFLFLLLLQYLQATNATIPKMINGQNLRTVCPML